ncbi:hypothetical protein CTAYLR_002361 [Chrysophaeum taylorii]|uniref:Histone deacetylase domain-containing protein n=1 Tax=Chrysophaeum taylorii TaxID=2483200 RepID=A0AAD7XJY6_9STRA|nr:hypothetical protein CTAYLR_002361 [Chrysophaeum taylorii]
MVRVEEEEEEEEIGGIVSPAESTAAEPGSEDDDSLLDALTPAFDRILGKRIYEDEDREPLRDCSNAERKQCTKATPVTVRQLKEKVAVMWSDAGRAHENGADHQESRARLDVLVGEGGALRDMCGVDVEESVARAPIADVVRVHDYEYVAHVEGRCKEGKALDTDTPVSPGSFDAALAAAGAALEAVDRVATRRRAAFVVARPPGHHAGPRGAAPCRELFDARPDMCSCGFCLFNTVAIAGAYARYRYAETKVGANELVFGKVAIVDVDVHHGNGTAEIVAGLRPRQVNLPLPSSWPPQSTLAYKPWLDESDAEHVFFASIHLRAPGFYPGGGAAGENTDRLVNVALAPPGGPRPGDAAARRALSASARKALVDKCSAHFRAAVERDLLPKLAAFAPDLLLISAGFDGHHSDLYYYLDDQDYYWITRSLLQAAKPKAVVSVLEGGYAVIAADPPTTTLRRTRQQTATARVPDDQQDSLCGLAAAAKAHVKALADYQPRL